MGLARVVLGWFLMGAFVLGLAFGRDQEETTVEARAVAGRVAVLFGEGGNIGVSAGPRERAPRLEEERAAETS